MKQIILLALIFVSCNIQEIPEHINPETCRHDVEWNKETGRIEIEIKSDLEYVDIYMGTWSTRIVKHYYRCVSLVKRGSGDELKIVSEETCIYKI